MHNKSLTRPTTEYSIEAGVGIVVLVVVVDIHQMSALPLEMFQPFQLLEFFKVLQQRILKKLWMVLIFWKELKKCWNKEALIRKCYVKSVKPCQMLWQNSLNNSTGSWGELYNTVVKVTGLIILLALQPAGRTKKLKLWNLLRPAESFTAIEYVQHAIRRKMLAC